jgi:hypothetical protein
LGIKQKISGKNHYFKNLFFREILKCSFFVSSRPYAEKDDPLDAAAVTRRNSTRFAAELECLEESRVHSFFHISETVKQKKLS